MSPKNGSLISRNYENELVIFVILKTSDISNIVVVIYFYLNTLCPRLSLSFLLHLSFYCHPNTLTLSSPDLTIHPLLLCHYFSPLTWPGLIPFLPSSCAYPVLSSLLPFSLALRGPTASGSTEAEGHAHSGDSWHAAGTTLHSRGTATCQWYCSYTLSHSHGSSYWFLKILAQGMS